ncbi:alpha/beta hydrolase family protein [Aquisalimonas asiatica]|uniref:Predicted alpha/beta hydrolase n=1 Tax=Aquisalimonas asiatica TaxID=406100 RepID=A0A1H8PXU4_9GAMM|nr:alpha/beta fold hydrolase [Aquisalimonas asiatica]SEO46568.1 Predicted alpha/beta hydrolase [Aquisalimonas asiatica]
MDQPLFHVSDETQDADNVTAITLGTPRGHTVALRVFEAQAPRAVVIVAGAMGVGQRAYERFARFLSEHGLTAITFDYYGIGASLTGPLRNCDAQVTDWATEDCEAVLQFALARYPDTPLTWIGHSVGGQLLGMIPSVNRLSQAVTVACGSGYWRWNATPTRRRVLALWYGIAPVSLATVGYFPGNRLGIVGDLPGGVMRQWRRWCLHPDYAVGVEGPAVRDQFASVRVPITAVTFTDDEMMSRKGIQAMHAFFRNAPVRMVAIRPSDIGEKKVGHLGWFRERYRDSIWAGQLLPLLDPAIEALQEARGA